MAAERDGWFWRMAMRLSWTGLWRPRVRVVDALGRTCVIDVESLGVFAKTLPPERGRPLFWSTLPPWYVRASFVLAAWMATVVVFALIAKWLKVGNSWGWAPVIFVVPIAVLLPLAAFSVPTVRTWHARRRCLHACAAAKVCPNCHYLLDGLVLSEGAAKCPECGFVWRMP